jgi:sugar O-acyltransferase (sialic acid O-acetyltransferase NeuD family)
MYRLPEEGIFSVVGCGGFCREVLSNIEGNPDLPAFVDPEYILEGLKDIRNFNETIYDTIVLIGDSNIRKKMIKLLPPHTRYYSLIDDSVYIHDSVSVGDGSVLCPGVKITCNISIGKHSILNLNTTVGHDCIIGDYFSAMPSVSISGSCHIGNNVYIGTNACIREDVSICDYVLIGMGSVVLKDINEPGVYVGNPLRKIK